MPFEDEAVMSTRAHWDKIYSEKAPNKVSWYRSHLEVSLALIEQVSPAPGTRVFLVAEEEGLTNG